jgi:predicted nucleic-acid-binding Zn-ribbon protein
MAYCLIKHRDSFTFCRVHVFRERSITLTEIVMVLFSLFRQVDYTVVVCKACKQHLEAKRAQSV